MTVRKTEQRIPAGFEPDDLGQAVSSSDEKVVLVSFLSSPIVQKHRQTYVVFVLDTNLISQVKKYEWTFKVGDINESSDTQIGYVQYKPEQQGSLTVNVSLKDGGGQTLKDLELTQEVIGPNAELTELYERDDEVAPVAGNPATSKEVINDLRHYMDELAPRDADSESSLNRFIFAISYVEVLDQPKAQRNERLEKIANAFNADDTSTFVEESDPGIGLCRIKPHILGMFLSETPGGNDWYLSREEYPSEESKRLDKKQKLLQALSGLSQEKQMDLFNLLRFPKSNLKMAIHLIKELKEKYFSGQDLESLIKDKEKAMLLIDQFKRGPYQSS